MNHSPFGQPTTSAAPPGGSGSVTSIEEHRRQRGVGLQPLCVDAFSGFTMPDGSFHTFACKHRATKLAEAAQKKIKITEIWCCLFCKEQYKTEEELRADHTDFAGYDARAEQHPFAAWSSDSLDPEHSKKLADIDKRIAGAKKVLGMVTASLENVESLEAYDAARKRMEVQEKTIAEETAKRNVLVDDILGWLSDGPTIARRADLADASAKARQMGVDIAQLTRTLRGDPPTSAE